MCKDRASLIALFPGSFRHARCLNKASSVFLAPVLNKQRTVDLGKRIARPGDESADHIS
jgi:hypothetical protein